MADDNPKPKRSDLIGDKIPVKEAYNPNGIAQSRDAKSDKIPATDAYNPNGLSDERNKKRK